MSEIGTPGAKDKTARLERAANAAQVTVNAYIKAMRKQFGREFGSQPVSTPEQQRQYLSLGDDVNAWGRFFETYGLEKGITWALEMESKTRGS